VTRDASGDLIEVLAFWPLVDENSLIEVSDTLDMDVEAAEGMTEDEVVDVISYIFPGELVAGVMEDAVACTNVYVARASVISPGESKVSSPFCVMDGEPMEVSE
jgi:hypothetical protein